MSLGRRFPISRSKFVENYIPLILDVVLCTRILFWQETQLKSRPDPHEHRATNTSQFWACPTMSSTWSTGKSGPGSIPWFPTFWIETRSAWHWYSDAPFYPSSLFTGELGAQVGRAQTLDLLDGACSGQYLISGHGILYHRDFRCISCCISIQNLQRNSSS